MKLFVNLDEGKPWDVFPRSSGWVERYIAAHIHSGMVAEFEALERYVGIGPEYYSTRSFRRTLDDHDLLNCSTYKIEIIRRDIRN